MFAASTAVRFCCELCNNPQSLHSLLTIDPPAQAEVKPFAHIEVLNMIHLCRMMTLPG